MKLLSIGSDTKTVKGEPYGFRTGIVYLAPASLSEVNVCPHSSPGCRAACLYTAGRGIQRNVQLARLTRAQIYNQDRKAFWAMLHREIGEFVRSCERAGVKPALRLNGTSDILVPPPEFYTDFPSVRWYDYTKNVARYNRWLSMPTERPKKHHLTFSLSEDNMPMANEFLQRGGNVAVVFRLGEGMQMPRFFSNTRITGGVYFNVIDGDLHDLRFLDFSHSIIGLRAKGRARHDETDFVVKLS